MVGLTCSTLALGMELAGTCFALEPEGTGKTPKHRKAELGASLGPSLPHAGWPELMFPVIPPSSRIRTAPIPNNNSAVGCGLWAAGALLSLLALSS